ncbi:hypothetical protein [Micrococcus sp.]|uniref:hypothetical protein n=1 Tax=Micrococcus sp. TaxID=1271 RepID=UPI002A90B62C|nr:hypothetical protein [Micrococcus sp.]MDY6055606.1 hypothetical protein [Micrococcus sp.]
MPTTPDRPSAPAGFVSPWQNGSALYRRLLLTGSGLFLVGIVLSVVGALMHRPPVSFAALGVLGLGVLVHLAAQTVRVRQAARRQGGTGQSRTGGR